jgi:tRNA(adenine34) deaminase
MNDLKWMQQAFECAMAAEKAGEVPVGAVIINANGELISSGYNQMIQQHDPTAHAEIVAIRSAGQLLNNYRLVNTTLYTTMEPCIMCAGAIIQARIQRIVFATRDPQRGAAGSTCNHFQSRIANHRVQIDEGILQEECSVVLRNFFKQRRVKKYTETRTSSESNESI